MSDTQETLSEFAPASEQELSRFVRENAEGERRPVYPVGGRTGLQFLKSSSSNGTLLSVQRLCDVIDYPARDMTITVGAGMRIGDLSSILAEENQQLPIDICHEQRATIGGAIACNVSGPRRFGLGIFRDYLIGMSAVDSEGRVFHAGGRVVKNVAGYDLCKLMIGSRGTLGILTEVTLKLKPRPEQFEAVWVNCDSFESVDRLAERMLSSQTRPVAMEAFTPEACQYIVADARISFPIDGPVFLLIYQGHEKELHWQIGRVREELKDAGVLSIEEVSDETSTLLLSTLREFPDGGDVPITFQANLLPSVTSRFLQRCTERGISAVARLGNGIVIGHLPEEAGPESQRTLIDELSRLSREQEGNLIVLNAEDSITPEVPWWGSPEAAWPLMTKIKHTLDPLGLLNPGATPFE
jgi:glycolate oxidase FAD binding subunit